MLLGYLQMGYVLLDVCKGWDRALYSTDSTGVSCDSFRVNLHSVNVTFQERISQHLRGIHVLCVLSISEVQQISSN